MYLFALIVTFVSGLHTAAMATGRSRGLGPVHLPTGATLENLGRKGGTLDESPGSADIPATTSIATAARRAETRT